MESILADLDGEKAKETFMDVKLVDVLEMLEVCDGHEAVEMLTTAVCKIFAVIRSGQPSFKTVRAVQGVFALKDVHGPCHQQNFASLHKALQAHCFPYDKDSEGNSITSPICASSTTEVKRLALKLKVTSEQVPELALHGNEWHPRKDQVALTAWKAYCKMCASDFGQPSLPLLGKPIRQTGTSVVFPFGGDVLKVGLHKAGRDTVEAEAAFRADQLPAFDCPQIVRYLGHGCGIQSSYRRSGMVLEMADGSLCDKHVVIHPITACRDILAALVYMHSRCLMHVDLKPGNVLVKDGRALLCDFGSARRSPNVGPARTTSLYADPKVLTLEFGVEVDVYSLGKIITRDLLRTTTDKAVKDFLKKVSGYCLRKNLTGKVDRRRKTAPELLQLVDNFIESHRRTQPDLHKVWAQRERTLPASVPYAILPPTGLQFHGLQGLAEASVMRWGPSMPGQFTVMSWNLRILANTKRGGIRCKEVAKFIEGSGATIVALQEVRESFVLDDLIAKLGNGWGYHRSDSPSGVKANGEVMVFVYRRPAVFCSSYLLGGAKEAGFSRAPLLAKFHVGASTVHIANVHLCIEEDKPLAEATALAQCIRPIYTLPEENGHNPFKQHDLCLVAGDFNVCACQETSALGWQHLIPVSVNTNKKLTRQYDNIYLAGGLRDNVVSSKRGHPGSSDHCAVLARFLYAPSEAERRTGKYPDITLPRCSK